jgi:hypothetical protein
MSTEPERPGPIRLWAQSRLVELYRQMNGDLAPLRPVRDGDDWQRVDFMLLHAVEQIFARAHKQVAFVLTKGSAEKYSELVYVFFEPLVDVVVAISFDELEASVCATNDLWPSLGSTFTELTELAEQGLKRGEVPDACISVAERAMALLTSKPGQTRGRS